MANPAEEELISKVVLDFPAFSITSFKEYVCVGGGGGASKTGVKNSLACFKIVGNKMARSTLVDLGPKPAYCLASADPSLLFCGAADTCKTFLLKEENGALQVVHHQDLPEPKDGPTKYISRVRFDSPTKSLGALTEDGSFLVWKLGGDNKGANPEYLTIFPAGEPRDSKMVDFEWFEGYLLAISASKVMIYDPRTSKAIHTTPSGITKDSCHNACRWVDKNTFVVCFVVPKKESFVTKFSFNATNFSLKEHETVKPFTHAHHTTVHISSNRLSLCVGSAKGDVCVVDLSKPEMTLIMRSSKLHTLPVTGITTIATPSTHFPAAIVSCSIAGSVVITPFKNNLGNRPLVMLFWLGVLFVAIALVFYMLPSNKTEL